MPMAFLNQEDIIMKYNFDDFVKIIEQLRGENGCPWDREQTYESLKPCLINETAEALGAINILKETNDCTNLCEELGDVLLQVVMLSQIAKEEGRFSMEDVVQGVSEKMIRRHPHVFGSAQVENSGQVLANWEDIKKKEKQGKTADYKRREKAATFQASKEMISHLKQELDKHEKNVTVNSNKKWGKHLNFLDKKGIPVYK